MEISEYAMNLESGYSFIQWRHKDESSSLPWIFKTVPSAMLSLQFYFLDFRFKSYNVRQLKLGMITVYVNYATLNLTLNKMKDT